MKASICGVGKCKLSVNYDEGSKWEGYKASDNIMVGGLKINSVDKAKDYTISNFEFGCQQSNTGEFKSQLANGVLSMSRDNASLPKQLRKKNITKNNLFAMCMRSGGGILTIGGVDSKINKKNSFVEYVVMTPSKDNYYTVKVQDISFRSKNTSMPVISLRNQNKNLDFVNNGTGAILDSATSDIFLPMAYKVVFNTAIKKFTGKNLNELATNKGFSLTPEQYGSLPDIIIKLQGKTKDSVDITIPYFDYIIFDSIKDIYKLKVYFKLQNGAILGMYYIFHHYLSIFINYIILFIKYIYYNHVKGENFFNRKNIIFDSNNQRIGIVNSDCIYENFVAKTLSPTKTPTVKPISKGGNKVDNCPKSYLSDCNADCFPVPQAKKSNHISQYYVSGTQDYKDCYGINSKTCHLSCIDAKIVRGNPYCADTEWTKCDDKCLQSKKKNYIYIYHLCY
jgi:hypothetical protein